MSRDEIYNKRIRPLMTGIIRICKRNNIAFAAQFMMDERNGYISSRRIGPGGVHIAEVVDAMLFIDLEKRSHTDAPQPQLNYAASDEDISETLKRVREQEIQSSSSGEKGPISTPCSSRDCRNC